MSRRLSPEECELDMDLDDQGWVKTHPVYCPVPWCSAHNLRYARCGDKDGEYDGIHKARIAYAAKAGERQKRAVARFRRIGVEDPEGAVSIGRMMQDSVDMGFMAGTPGRRTYG